MGRIIMSDKTQSYLMMFQSLLPSGQAWNRESGSSTTNLLTVMSSEFAKIHGRADDLLNEADPRTTIELLSDWESNLGLPDTCTGGFNTIQERRDAVVQKVTMTGGQSAQYFKDVAAAIGYEIEIAEFRPFVCGLSECALTENIQGNTTLIYGITDQEDIRFNWRVTVLGSRVTWFSCGVSELGKDHFAEIANASDLECLLNRIKPSHTNLIFSYDL